MLALLLFLAAAKGSPFEMPLLYPVDGNPVVRRDVVYRTDGGTPLLADIYLPRGGTKRPIAVFVHGGPIEPSMQPKNWRVYRDYGRLLASNGFVAVTFNHRLFEEGKYATSSADFDALLDYVRAHAAELKADPDHVIVWVFSGGGPLVSTAMQRPFVRRIVDFYGFLDAPAPFSPVEHVRAGQLKVPMLIARGGRDNEKLNAALLTFVTEALARGVTLELLNHPEGVHAFDILTDDARTREIIHRAVEFSKEAAP